MQHHKPDGEKYTSRSQLGEQAEYNDDNTGHEPEAGNNNSKFASKPIAQFNASNSQDEDATQVNPKIEESEIILSRGDSPQASQDELSGGERKSGDDENDGDENEDDDNDSEDDDDDHDGEDDDDNDDDDDDDENEDYQKTGNLYGADKHKNPPVPPGGVLSPMIENPRSRRKAGVRSSTVFVDQATPQLPPSEPSHSRSNLSSNMSHQLTPISYHDTQKHPQFQQPSTPHGSSSSDGQIYAPNVRGKKRKSKMERESPPHSASVRKRSRMERSPVEGMAIGKGASNRTIKGQASSSSSGSNLQGLSPSTLNEPSTEQVPYDESQQYASMRYAQHQSPNWTRDQYIEQNENSAGDSPQGSDYMAYQESAHQIPSQIQMHPGPPHFSDIPPQGWTSMQNADGQYFQMVPVKGSVPQNTLVQQSPVVYEDQDNSLSSIDSQDGAPRQQPSPTSTHRKLFDEDLNVFPPHPYGPLITRLDNGSDNSAPRIELIGDLEGMLRDWDVNEIKSSRRLVRFQRVQEGTVIKLFFAPISESEYKDEMTVISCIWNRNTHEFCFTSVDCIYLLEVVIDKQFPVDEKNRVRRNLEVCKPTTVSKNKGGYDSFFKQIMKYENPRPRTIEKDVKVFAWSMLDTALRKIVAKYNMSVSEDTPNLSQNTHSSSSQEVYGNIGDDLASSQTRPWPKKSSKKRGPHIKRDDGY